MVTNKEQIKFVKAVEIKPILLVCPTFATMLPVDQTCKDIEKVQVVSSPRIVVIQESNNKGQCNEEEEEAKEEEKCLEKKVVIMEAKAVTVEEVKVSETQAEAEEEKPEKEEKEQEQKEEGGKEEENQEQKEQEQDQEVREERQPLKEGEKEEEKQEHKEQKEEVREEGQDQKEGEQQKEKQEQKEQEQEVGEELREERHEAVEKSEVEARLFCPSPSFRVYCIQPLDNDKETEDKEDDITERKTDSEDSNGGSIVVSETEESMNKIKKRVQKGRRSTVVKLPRGKSMPRAMKNWLKVKSCYNPACGGGHIKVHLLKGSV